jgi:ABC-type lipoprotein export system ATPase subunit
LLGRRKPEPSPAPSPPRGAEIVVDRVSKTFGRIQALHEVSMEVARGEWLTITGPSGSGKTTLLNVIGSLEVPDAGRVLVDSEPVPVPARAVAFRREVVGFVFQDSFLLPYLSAQSNVETALLSGGMHRAARQQRSLELLAEVGLTDRAAHIPAELSGGQKQGVALARALANDPRLLLADEPTGSLDSVSSERALDMLGAVRERRGTTLIVVSHDPAVAARADRVVHLVDGRIEDLRSALALSESQHRTDPHNPPDRVKRSDRPDQHPDQRR